MRNVTENNGCAAEVRTQTLGNSVGFSPSYEVLSYSFHFQRAKEELPRIPREGVTLL
jgi:hypothetical protein